MMMSVVGAFWRILMIRKFILPSVLLASVAWALGGCEMADAHRHAEMFASTKTAIAVLQPTDGNANVKGVIMFENMGDHLHVWGEVSGLAANSTHGFHIHEFGDASSKDGTAAGGHYNPQGEKHQHANIGEANAHAGDLGNIVADGGGTAKIDLHVANVSVAGVKNPVLGRAVVVHANPDDLKSQPAGNAGPRIAVGVIGVRKKP
jgi:superoxide dismutase, Cu-Zn family